jgi:hypothetical protein
MWVKPMPGLRVRDYRTKQLWPEGEAVEVPDFDYVFHQAINHGDLVECDEPTPPAPAAVPTKAKAQPPED